MEAALSTKGQVTIPKAIREKLNLVAGDRVKFFMDVQGRAVILPKLPITALRGIVKSRLGRPATLEEIDQAIIKGAIRRSKRR